MKDLTLFCTCLCEERVGHVSRIVNTEAHRDDDVGSGHNVNIHVPEVHQSQHIHLIYDYYMLNFHFVVTRVIIRQSKTIKQVKKSASRSRVVIVNINRANRTFLRSS